MNRFFTMLRFVQNDNVLFLLTIRNLYNWGIVFKRKDFLFSLCSIRSGVVKDELRDTRYEVQVFLSQSSRRLCEMMAFLRALRNIGDILGSALFFLLL